MARRVTRKMLKQNDFISLFDEVAGWFADNWRPVAAGCGAIVVVVLVWWGASVWSGSRAEKASYLLSRAEKVLEGDATGPGSLAAAEPLLREVVERYGRSHQADVARLYLARFDLGRGEVDAARTVLQSLASRRQKTPIGVVATLDLLHLRIATGQGAEVAAELEAMVSAPAPPLPRDTALYELGVLLLNQDRTTEAREQLDRLVKEFPESSYRFPAQQKLTELG